MYISSVCIWELSEASHHILEKKLQPLNPEAAYEL